MDKLSTTSRVILTLAIGGAIALIAYQVKLDRNHQQSLANNQVYPPSIGDALAPDTPGENAPTTDKIAAGLPNITSNPPKRTAPTTGVDANDTLTPRQ